MENLKIRVTTEQESKEAQELFFELGYGWHGKGKLVSYLDEILSNGFGWLVLWKPPYLTNTVIQMGSGFEDCKEITLQELRAMADEDQDEPILTPETTLNDKIATAEVARQESKSIDATLAERQSKYGSFTGVANTTGQLMAIIKNSPNGHTMPYAHEEALHMICSKIARIVNGDINHLDSWHDIGGYSKLIEDLIGDNSEI